LEFIGNILPSVGNLDRFGNCINYYIANLPNQMKGTILKKCISVIPKLTEFHWEQLLQMHETRRNGALEPPI
jgi:hypothetical protein